MKAFRGVDYFQCRELLTKEELAVQDAVRRWVENKYLPKLRRTLKKVFSTGILFLNWLSWGYWVSK